MPNRNFTPEERERSLEQRKKPLINTRMLRRMISDRLRKEELPDELFIKMVEQYIRVGRRPGAWKRSPNKNKGVDDLVRELEEKAKLEEVDAL